MVWFIVAYCLRLFSVLQKPAYIIVYNRDKFSNRDKFFDNKEYIMFLSKLRFQTNQEKFIFLDFSVASYLLYEYI